jgi:hypothetical protein
MASQNPPALLLLHGSGHHGMSLIDPWKDLAAKDGITAGCARFE